MSLAYNDAFQSATNFVPSARRNTAGGVVANGGAVGVASPAHRANEARTGTMKRAERMRCLS
ncbi:MAG: hypothetical protein AAB263_00280 [Planctomycetota bacterium]